jgi:zinc protease
MNRKTLFIFCLLFGLSACASSKSVIGEDSDVVSDVQEFSVDGIHIVMRQSIAAPVVSAVLFINGGESMSDGDEPIATEYFALSIAPASGSQRIGKSYFRRKMIAMGTGISGEAGRDYSALSLRCTRENFDTSWAYFSDIVLHPAFDPVEFDNFRKSVLLGINSRMSDPDSYSNFIADSIYFRGHSYGRIMSVQDVNLQSIPIMQKHYSDMMVKSRFLLSVVGNIYREELKRKIHATIGQLPLGSFMPVAISPPAKAFSPGAYFPRYDRKLPTDYVVGYFLTPSKGDSDYYPYLRLRNFFGGFVFNHIRVQPNLAYAPNVDDREGRTDVGIISFQTPYVDSAVRIVFNDVDFFQNNLIRESAIHEGVAGWATRNYLKTETTQSQAALLGQAVLTTGDWHNAFFSYEKLAAVKPEQIVLAARKYLRNFNWIVVGDTTYASRALLESR